MIGLVLFLVQTTQPETLAFDYFPLRPGNKWTYEYQSQGRKGRQIDEVLEPVTLDGLVAFPVSSQVDGKSIGNLYYRFEGEKLFIVAEDVAKPLKVPRLILHVGRDRIVWDFSGQALMQGDQVTLDLHGETTPVGERTFARSKSPTIEAKISALYSDHGLALGKTVQTSYYSKNVGIIEMKSEQFSGAKPLKTTLKLIKFEHSNGSF